MKNLGILFTLFAFLSACKEDVSEPITPTPTVQESDALTVHIHHKFKEQPLVLNDETYTLASGEEVNFSRLSYLMGDFYLVDESGSRFYFDMVLLSHGSMYLFINNVNMLLIVFILKYKLCSTNCFSLHCSKNLSDDV